MADVARLAGVSRTTVSFVLNNVPSVHISETTRRRVLEAAKVLDYHPHAVARSLARRQTRTLGLVLCQSPDRISADAFLPEVIRGISAVASRQGFAVLLQPVEDVHAPNAYAYLVSEKRIDGIILSGPRSDDQQLLRLHAQGFPIVLLGQLPGADFSFVDVDNVGGARMAVEHLIRLGHRCIGMITNAPLEYTAAQDRLTGYRQALEAHGLPFDRSLVAYGDFSEQSGEMAMRQLLTLDPRPTAVFVASDVVAFGAVSAIKAAGLRIPEDMAVVGFDDIPLARYIDPPLTTVRLPAATLGRKAAEVLLQRLADGGGRTSVILEAKLVVRESCGASRQRSPEAAEMTV